MSNNPWGEIGWLLRASLTETLLGWALAVAPSSEQGKLAKALLPYLEAQVKNCEERNAHLPQA